MSSTVYRKEYLGRGLMKRELRGMIGNQVIMNTPLFLSLYYIC